MSAIVTYQIGTRDTQKEVSGLHFGLISADEAERLSVVEITEPSLYTRGMPMQRGLMDTRLGTVDRRVPCGSCGGNVRQCPGHWGSIRLARPIWHVAFVETGRKILNCVCYACSRLRVPSEQLPPAAEGVTQRKQRLGVIYTLCRHRKSCPHCGVPCPIVIRKPTSHVNVAADWDHIDALAFSSEEEKQFCVERPLDAALAREILSAISDEDVVHLGLDPATSHPRDMILTTMLVPPPIIRPSIMVSEGSRARGQDDLTMRLVEVVKRNEALRKVLQRRSPDDPDDAEVCELWERLAQDVAVYMHNTPRGRISTQRSGVPTKCLFSRLKGKQGRFRSNLMGKRVNFSGRSVISPDPTLDVDEIGVPVQMALQLTHQEHATAANLPALRQRVRLGSGVLDGAETVIRPDGSAVQMAYCESREDLAASMVEGWIVERPLQDGDFLIFNRQPTLHRMGMMGHRVKIMRRGNTLRCSLAVVTPYNADFDGDEMNVHKPQSKAAQTEVELLMSVTEQLVSPQASRPVMGIVQDALVGAHLLSAPDVLLTLEEVTSLLAAASRGGDLEARTRIPEAAYPLPEPALWTGKQIIETLLPPEVSMTHGDVDSVWSTATDDASVNTVAGHALVVRRGKFLSGQLKKATLGISSGSLVHHVLLAVDNACAAAFVGDLQRVVNRWLLERGFSIGIGDCVPSSSCDQTMRVGIDRVMRHIDRLQAEVPQWSAVTIGDGDSGRTSLEKIQLERCVHRMVGGVQMSTGALVRREMSHGNGLGAMVRAGSKGNPINICQILCCVGQNCVSGERLGRDGCDTRTLPSYAHGDQSVDGAGFVANSYLSGLTGTEVFFHAKGGREGLVDTAVKTSKTGYYQRRLVKGMESHRAEHDLSVRDASQNLVELLYGGDGVNPALLERTPLVALAMGDRDMQVAVGERGASHGELERLRSVREEVRELRMHVMAKSPPEAADVAVNPRRVLHLVLAHHEADDPCREEALTTLEAVESLGRVVECLAEELTPQATCNLRLALLYELRSAVVVEQHALSRRRWQGLLETIERSILESLLEAGEMVGCVAAQSIGEPATQMTLNTVPSLPPLPITPLPPLPA